MRTADRILLFSSAIVHSRPVFCATQTATRRQRYYGGVHFRGAGEREQLGDQEGCVSSIPDGRRAPISSRALRVPISGQVSRHF